MIYSNAIKINVIIGSMMAASTKTLQFISVIVLKIIFKAAYSGRMVWTLRLRTAGSLIPGRLDSASLDAWTLDNWNLDAWTLGCLDNRLTVNN